MRGSERSFSVAYGIWLFGVFAYFVPAATWNPVSHFDLTRAIVEDRTFSIDRYADNTGDRARAAGRWYTEKAPIPSLLAVPAYTVFHASQRLRGQRPEYSVYSTDGVQAERVTVNGAFQRGLYVCSLSTAGAATALLGVLLFQVLRRRFSPHAAFFGSASTVLGTPLLPYATSFYGHGVAAALLFGAIAALLGDPGQAPSSRRIRIAGACVALASGSEYLAFIPGAVLVVGWLATSRAELRSRQLFDLALGAVAPAAIVAGYHWACFGAPWRTGYSFVVRPEFARGHASGLLGLHAPTLEGLAGLLVGGRRGLFVLSPLCALSLVLGMQHAWRARDAAARVAVLAFAALLFVNAGYYMWWGGAAAGPRHLVPVLAAVSFGAAAGWDTRWRWLLGPLAVVSIVNFVVLTGVGLEGPDHGNLLFDYAYRHLANGEVAVLSGASNLGLRLGMAGSATLAPIVIWMFFGGRYLVRELERRHAAEPDSTLA